MNTREIATEYRLTHWAQIMRERKESGQSVKAYCEKTGICKNVYCYWQRKLREATCGEIVASNAETVPNGWTVCKPTTNKANIYVEIGKYRISVDNNFNPELLTQVCKLLSSL